MMIQKGQNKKSEIIYSETDKQMHIHTPHATVPSSGRVLTDFPKLSFSFLAREASIRNSPKFQQMLLKAGSGKAKIEVKHFTGE